MFGYLLKGGIAMVPLMACSIALLAVLLERRHSLETLRLDLGQSLLQTKSKGGCFGWQ